MIVTLPCGHTIDDAVVSTTCTPEGHYPISAPRGTYCKRCDLFKPCLCDEGKNVGAV